VIEKETANVEEQDEFFMLVTKLEYMKTFGD
jgi:hypothetical protein